MEKEISKVRVLLLMVIICLIVGFLFCAKGPKYVFIGNIVLLASSCVSIVALFPALRIYKLRKAQNEAKK